MTCRPDTARRWTTMRQVRFIEQLAATRNVSVAARAAGMSRESAYRLRRRPAGAAFAAAWDRAMTGRPMLSREQARVVRQGMLRDAEILAVLRPTIYRPSNQANL